MIFQRVWQTQWSVNLHAAVSAEWVLRSSPIRRGLRRYSQIGSSTPTNSGGATATIRVIAEVHFDGSVGVAITRGGAFGRDERPDDRMLATSDLDQAALNLFTLAQQTASELHVHGDYQAFLTVEPAVALFRRPDPLLGSVFQEFSEADRIGIFHPVTGPFLMSQGTESRLDSLVDFAEDAVNQTRTGSLLEVLRPQ
jgi:hypothetical protein